METQERNHLADKKRIVIKIGSSSLTHEKTGEVNLMKIEKLVRVISDLRGEGKEVVLVSSGAIAAGRQALGHRGRPDSRPLQRWTGPAYDELPENICRVQSDSGPGTFDEGYYGQ